MARGNFDGSDLQPHDYRAVLGGSFFAEQGLAKNRPLADIPATMYPAHPGVRSVNPRFF